MVYIHRARPRGQLSSEVDPTGSLWYSGAAAPRRTCRVLKLTLPGHYGIIIRPDGADLDQVLKLILPGHYGISSSSLVQVCILF